MGIPPTDKGNRESDKGEKMTTLEWILFGYIIYSNIMAIIFLLTKKSKVTKVWFAILMILALPIAFTEIYTKLIIEEIKLNTKEKK
jgi:succinate-acetate transporter protein